VVDVPTLLDKAGEVVMGAVADLDVGAAVALEAGIDVDVAAELDLTAAVLSEDEPAAARPWVAAPPACALVAGTAGFDALGAPALAAAVRPAMTGVDRPASTSEN
jgi:hypothetical protein